MDNRQRRGNTQPIPIATNPHSAPHHPSPGGPRKRPPNRSGYPPTSQGRKPGANRRVRMLRRRLISLTILIVLIVGIVLLVSKLFNPRETKETFIENVSINGISISGYTREEATTLLEEKLSSWQNTQYTLVYLDQTWNFSPDMIDASFDYSSKIDNAWNLGHVGSTAERNRIIESVRANPVDLSAPLQYDEAKLDAFIQSLANQIDIAAVDAQIYLDIDQPRVLTEGRTGLALNQEQLKEQIIDVLNNGNGDLALPVETVFPQVSSDAADFQLIAQFSTDVTFRNSASRQNVRLGLQKFNGFCLKNGQRYSFNDIVGPRTKEAGFQRATEYAGDRTVEGYGGGICQSSTTLYNALILAGITIIDREPHSMKVSYVAPSCDAAVADGTIGNEKDLVFENNTGYDVYIYTEVTSETATVTIYGHRPPYRYELMSVMIEDNIAPTSYDVVQDTAGQYVYYTTDTPYLHPGTFGCTSEGWLISYDWETNTEVSRTLVSHDEYRPGVSVYYVGVHEPTPVYVPNTTNY